MQGRAGQGRAGQGRAVCRCTQLYTHVRQEVIELDSAGQSREGKRGHNRNENLDTKAKLILVAAWSKTNT